MIKTEFLLPVKLLKSEGKTRGEEHLLTSTMNQIHVGTPIVPLFSITGKGYILLDFGKELRGGIRIIAKYAQHREIDTNIRIRFGESANECMAELSYKGACNAHSPRDFSVPLSNLSDTSWGNTGFRFVRIDFDGRNEGEIFVSVTARSEILDRPAIYEYKGSDPVLKEIYDTAKRTIDLCAAGDYVWDGIKRDRLVWIGDMHPEMLALITLYGQSPELENSISFLRQITSTDEWMCGIATYSAWWIIVLADYCKATGRYDFCREHLDYTASIIERFLKFTSDEGDMPDTEWTLVDWPTSKKPDEKSGARAIFTIMAKRALWMFEKFGAPTDRVTELLNRLQKKPILVTHAMQVAGLKYFALGELEKSDVELMENLGENGLSTFMSYYILTAYAHYLGKDKAVEVMKKYYSGMLSVGATTFWEDFHLDWLEGSGRIDELTPDELKDIHADYGDFCYKGFRHSLCHAWSTGILAFMKEFDV